ncbi:MAG: hypothetical protein IT459_19215 [Planctomycetes bacterium]|nr:hypothetical protein [Planctomycetota bacterium]
MADETPKQVVRAGLLKGLSIDHRGRVRVWEIATKSWISRDPIDARELVEKKLALLEEPAPEPAAPPPPPPPDTTKEPAKEPVKEPPKPPAKT